MTNFIPLFPLDIIVFPEEEVTLHIFEERYKQLILHCLADKKPFGIIAPNTENGILEVGTAVEVTKVIHTYADGKMDIVVKGKSTFSVIEYIAEIPNKLYSGAIVTHLPYNTKAVKVDAKLLVNKLIALYKKLEYAFPLQENNGEITSYQIAKIAGITYTQAYYILCLEKEDQRLEYLKRHINALLGEEKPLSHLINNISLN